MFWLGNCPRTKMITYPNIICCYLFSAALPQKIFSKIAFMIGLWYSTLDLLYLQKRRINPRHLAYLSHETQGSSIFFKIKSEEPLENLKTCCVTYLGPELSNVCQLVHFCQSFSNLFRDLGPLTKSLAVKSTAT